MKKLKFYYDENSGNSEEMNSNVVQMHEFWKTRSNINNTRSNINSAHS